jgi:nitrogen fixation/metabolism regulation signal transduction histidine kinase
MQQRLINQLSDAGRSTGGRLVLHDSLFLWQRLDSDSLSLIAGRWVPGKYFQLANQLLEGRTKYESLSRTLLPIGQGLLLKIAIALTAISLILSLLTAQTLAYGMSSPLERLVDATKKISRGNLKHRISGGGRDEIGELIVHFNQMTEDLQQTTGRLLAAEREMAWKETARTIAHEIKNLLTPVNVAIFKVRQELKNREIADADLTRAMATLETEVSALAELARQFSLFAHPTRLALTSVNLRDVAAEAVSLQDTTETQQVAVEFDEQLPEVRADRDLLRRALSNLIKNSLDAIPYGGHITIKGGREPSAILLQVQDDGPGADEAIDLALPYVTTKKSGTGLGLAIVKKICEAHGWSLSYGNSDPGFLVTISIPYGDARASVHS